MTVFVAMSYVATLANLASSNGETSFIDYYLFGVVLFRDTTLVQCNIVVTTNVLFFSFEKIEL